MTTKTALDCKIPPLAVASTLAAAMWLAARIFPGAKFTIPFHNGLAALLIVSGLLVFVAAALAFRRARTTVNPLDPTAAEALVTKGIYRYSRNPMYLALLLALAAWATILGSWAAMIVLPVFVVYMDRFQIGPEERALRDNFGAAFDAYTRSVRRWI